MKDMLHTCLETNECMCLFRLIDTLEWLAIAEIQNQFIEQKSDLKCSQTYTFTPGINIHTHRLPIASASSICSIQLKLDNKSFLFIVLIFYCGAMIKLGAVHSYP